MKLKKSLFADVSDHTICSTHRMITLVTSVDRYGPKQACKHIDWVMVAHRKFSSATQSSTFSPQKLSFWSFYLQICLLGSMKLKKSLFADVSDHTICSTHRMITLVTSVDRYGPKQACKHIDWVMVAHRKFSSAAQSSTFSPQKLSF